MSAAVRQLLNSFEALPAAEKHVAAVEILRRASADDDGDISESALVEIAEDLFRGLDADEARDAAS